MFKKILIGLNFLYLLAFTGPTFLDYLPHYGQLAQVYQGNRTVHLLLGSAYPAAFLGGYFLALLSLGLVLKPGKKTSKLLLVLALVNLFFCSPLLYQAL